MESRQPAPILSAPWARIPPDALRAIRGFCFDIEAAALLTTNRFSDAAKPVLLDLWEDGKARYQYRNWETDIWIARAESAALSRDIDRWYRSGALAGGPPSSPRSSTSYNFSARR